MASPAALSLQEATRDRLGARNLQESPYLNSHWKLSKDAYLKYAEPLNSSVRVFYLKRYLKPSQISRLLTQVPYICTDGDTSIVTQDRRGYHNLESCLRDHPDQLISADERRLSRSKCVASFVKIFATGGYKAPLRVFDKTKYFDCVVVSGAGPQFEAPYLDYADFIIEKSRDGTPSRTRLPAYSHLGASPSSWADVESHCVTDEVALKKMMQLENSSPFDDLPCQFFRFSTNRALDIVAFLTSLRECIHLWLTAFNTLVAIRAPNRRAGYFKLVAIGTGFFANVAGTGYNLGRVLLPMLFRAATEVLMSKAQAYPHIQAIEFPDFSQDGSYSPPEHLKEVGGIRLVPAPRRDVLDFPDEVRGRNLIPGVLNPGDCFAFVGNETSYGSVEAMIGCNSTLRINQNYLWNAWVLDSDRAIGVDDLSKKE